MQKSEFLSDPYASKDATSSWLLLGAILALSAFYWLANYHPFILPPIDFLRIKTMSVEFMNGQTPQNLKQMPLVPLMIGALTFFIPFAGNPYLHAALVLNILLSLASLVLLYMLAREFLGQWLALVPVVLMLTNPQFTLGAHLPLLEPSIGVLVLATMVALARGSQWAYVLAGLCALTRYEMVVILPMVFVVEIMRNPRDWLRHGLRCMVAGLPFCVWYGISVFVGANGNTYLKDMKGMGFKPNWQVFWTMHSPLAGQSLLMLGNVALAWLVGLYVAFRRNAPIAAGIAIFFVLYTVAHIAFGIDRPRYVYPAVWVLPMLICIAVHAILLQLRSLAHQMPTKLHLLLAVLLAVFVLVSVGRMSRFFTSWYVPSPVASITWSLGWSFLLLAALAGIVFMAARRPIRFGAIAALLALSLASYPVISSGLALPQIYSSKYFDKAEYAVAADWLSANLNSDSRVVVPLRSALLEWGPGISPDQLVDFSDLKAKTPQELIKEMDELGVEYVMFIHRPERPINIRHANYLRDLYYYNKLKVYLMDPFRHGQPVEGFELVTSLPPTNPKRNAYSHIYHRAGHDTTF